MSQAARSKKRQLYSQDSFNKLSPVKRWYYRDDSQRRLLAQHSVAMVRQCCNYSKQHHNNVATLCCLMWGNPDSKIFEVFAWNPEFSARDTESEFSWQGMRNPVPGNRNHHSVESRIQECLGWPYIGQYEAYFKTYATDISIIKEIKGDVKNQP